MLMDRLLLKRNTKIHAIKEKCDVGAGGGGGREHFHLFLRSLLGVKTLYTSQWIHVTCTQA